MIEPSKYRPLSEITKNELENAVIEVLVAHVANREKTDLADVATVNLSIRPEWLEKEKKGESYEQEDELGKKGKSSKKNKKNKGGKKSGKKKGSEDYSDEDESKSEEKKD